MDAQSHFFAVYKFAAEALEWWLGEKTPGVVVTIDLGGSFFDCVASSAASSAGHELVKSPSLLRYRSRLWDCCLPPKPTDVIAEPVLFGAVDGWMRFIDDVGLTKNYALSASAVATRSIDSWSVGRFGLRLIHFGDVENIGDQWQGALETIARDRPIVTLYPPPAPTKAVLLSSLQYLNYEVFDLNFAAVCQDEPDEVPDFGWIAVPSETPLRSIPDTRHPPTDDWGRQFAKSRYIFDRNALSRQRQSNDVFGLAKVASPELARSVSIDQVTVCNDCYPLESEGANSWRWLGPRARSRLAVPCPFPGSYRFEASVIGYRCANGLRNCRVLVEGREVPTTVVGEDRGTIAFIGHVESTGYKGYAEIDFINPGSPPPAGADSRILRMNLASISVSPC